MKVINGNNIDILKQYPDNYFDAIVTDPPYGLGKEPNAEELMKDWIEKGYHEISGTGFMGKEWDAFIPQPIFWKEVFRVLKHGGHVLSFFGTRTYDWGVMSMRFAGFEVRDCIQWLYGSGFPKSHNISKAIDKMYGAEREVIGKSDYTMPKADNSMSENSYGISGGKLANGNTAERITANITAPSTDFAKQWDGWGSALKPANEPIVLARKPLEKGLTIAENVLKWGTGAINIDGCRIGTGEDKIKGGCQTKGDAWNKSMTFNQEHKDKIYSQGRFPANLILTHHEDCECMGTKKVKGTNDGIRIASSEFGQNSGWNDHKNKDTIRKGTANENGEETIEDWNCVDDCPIKILDEQSGESKGTIRKPNGKPILNVESGWNDNSMIDNTTRGHNDKGGASRFFYVAKASKSERNKGLDGFDEKTSGSLNFRNPSSSGRSEDAPSVENMGGISKPKTNFHPTVKPIKLMQYLVRLIAPPNGIVLDPFCGSGTTGVACKLEGVQFIGIEQDAEYFKIAQARIDNYIEETIKKPKIQETDIVNQIKLF